MPAMEAGERIRSERERRGWSQRALADKAGVSQPTIKKIEAGDTDRSRFLARVANVLSIPMEELDPQLSAPAVPTAVIPQERLQIGIDFPIYVSAEGGPGQIIVSNEAVDWVPRPVPLQHVRESYGLIVTGTSMEPEYRPGDTALVNPHLPAIGDEVFIFYAEKTGEARATIKHLRKATSDTWHVRQFNPLKDFQLSRKEWQWAHRVVGKYSRR